MELRSWMARLEAAREKCEQLEHLRAVVTPDFWERVQETIEREAATAQNLKLPVLFFLLDRRDVKALQPLNQFLGYLRKHSNKRARRESDKLAGHLQKRTTDYRKAAGAVFEMEILSHLLKKSLKGHFDPYPQIPNGRVPDASIRLGEKTVYLEATILSQTEDQERVWDTGHERSNPTQKEMEKSGVRKVSHHSSFSILEGGSDPYREALRFIKKIEDKREQLADKSPNILCIGLPDSDPNSLSAEWGINAIFSGDLKPAQSIIRRQKGRLSNDKSLPDVEIQQIKKDIGDLEQREREFQDELRLTGILVFRWERSDFLPEKPFWNPCPHSDSRLSPAEQKTILDWFGFPKENAAMEDERPRVFKIDRVEAAKRKRILELARSEVAKKTMARCRTRRRIESYGRRLPVRRRWWIRNWGIDEEKALLEQITMLCSHPSFLREQESRPPSPLRPLDAGPRPA